MESVEREQQCIITLVLYLKRNKYTDNLYHEDKKGVKIRKKKEQLKTIQQAQVFGTPSWSSRLIMVLTGKIPKVVPLFKQDNDAAAEMYSF